jgi:hypothetical protein
MAATALLKLAGFTNEFRYVDIVHRALADILSKPREIAIVGDPDSADTRALLSIVRESHRPFQMVALGSPEVGNAADGLGSIAAVPFLEGLGLVERQAAAHASPAPEHSTGFWFSALNCPFLTVHHSFYPGLDKLWQSWYNSRCTGMQD